MDVELYVYDLSRGMARQYSQALAGIYIDAIYHTAIVFGGVECESTPTHLPSVASILTSTSISLAKAST